MAGLFAFSTASAHAQVAWQQTNPLRQGTAVTGLTLQATGTETGTWSSNPLLLTEGATPLWGSTTSPELVFKDTTPESQLNVDARVDENVFNQSTFDSTDVHATTGLTTQNQRWTAGLQQQTDYDTTRTSELTNYGLAPVVARHLGLSVAPQIGFNSTPVDTFSLMGSAAMSQYDSNLYTNYETLSATPSYTHRFDPQNAGIILLQGQQYQTTKNNATKIDSVGPSVGWQTVLSPRFAANAAIGAQTSRQYEFGNAVDPWTWAYTFSGGLAFKGEQDTINLSTARQQFPYGNGTEALQTSFSFSEAHALNNLFSLNFGASYISSTYQIGGAGNLKDLGSGNIGLAYHASERLDLTTAYQYRYETLTGESKTAQDNSITVSLAYHPNVWTLLQ